MKVNSDFNKIVAYRGFDLKTNAVSVLAGSIESITNAYSDTLYKFCKDRNQIGLALKEKRELTPVSGYQNQVGDTIIVSVVVMFKIDAKDWIEKKGGLFGGGKGLARHVSINPMIYGVEELNHDEYIHPKTPLKLEFDLDPFTGKAMDSNVYQELAKKVIDDMMEEVSPVLDKIDKDNEEEEKAKKSTKYSRKTLLMAADRLVNKR